jgi:hypothetical protein
MGCTVGDRVARDGGNPLVTRAYVFPEPGDTLALLAARVLPGREDGRAVLLGWNPHLALRAATMDVPGGMLPTDLVYIEPAMATPT